MKNFVSTCPACGKAVANEPFYTCASQPANSVILCQSQETAKSVTKGDISLLLCPACCFIFNAAYDPEICIYDRKYEETQAHSEVFNAFHHYLASSLLKRYELHNKVILEIGCGKGDFLNLLCRMGKNRGIGFDPSYVANRSQTILSENVTIHNQLFPGKYEGEQMDCIICKMTLEHIADVQNFLGRVRRAIAFGRRPIVFFQVPDTTPIFKERRFWDIYYEHCSYFTRESLSRFFQQCGFEILAVTSGYEQQYLMIEALPIDVSAATELIEMGGGPEINSLVHSFSRAVRLDLHRWQQLLLAWQCQNRKIALWGGGSKAVAFLASLKYPSTVELVVDINPHKQGCYLPGSGHLVVSPESLVKTRPDIILIMNPVYTEEIRDQLLILGLQCELFPLSNEGLDTIENE